MPGKNYAIKGVRILNEARFRSSDEVISKRYPEDQASGNEDASHKRPDRNGLSQTPWIQMSRTFLTWLDICTIGSFEFWSPLLVLHGGWTLFSVLLLTNKAVGSFDSSVFNYTCNFT